MQTAARTSTVAACAPVRAAQLHGAARQGVRVMQAGLKRQQQVGRPEEVWE